MFNIATRETVLGVVSLLIAILLAFLLKRYIVSRTPNGRKDGIVDTSIVLAFSAVSIIAMITKDPFIISMTLLLAYLVSKTKWEGRKSYIYQIVISLVLGLAVPYGVYWLNEKWENRNSYSHDYKSYTEIEPRESSDHSSDERHEADEHEEYKLEPSHSSQTAKDELTAEEIEFLESL
jgi:ABC-type nickel/cobalt efflux system permease component RcnA